MISTFSLDPGNTFLHRWSKHLDGNPSTTYSIFLFSLASKTSSEEETIPPLVTLVLDVIVFGFKGMFPHHL